MKKKVFMLKFKSIQALFSNLNNLQQDFNNDIIDFGNPQHWDGEIASKFK